MMPAAAPIDDDAHQHALTLAALGLRVLPIKPGGKSPPMNSWQHAATGTVGRSTPGSLATCSSQTRRTASGGAEDVA